MTSLIQIAALGIAIPANAVRKLELRFQSRANYVAIVPSNSMEVIEVNKHDTIEYGVLMHYVDPIEDKLTVATLETRVYRLSVMRAPLRASDAYVAMTEKARENLDKRIKFFVRHLRKQEQIELRAARAVQQNDVGNVNMDLPVAVHTMDDDLIITDEDKVRQDDRIAYIREKVGTFELLGEELDMASARAIFGNETVLLNAAIGLLKVHTPVIDG